MKKDKNQVLEQFIEYHAMADVVHSSLIALPVIIGFEIAMIISWILRFEHSWTLGSAGYMAAYLGLIAVSVFCYFLFRYFRRDTYRYHRSLYVWQNIYAMLIFIWALAITTLDAVTRTNFDVIVYITIMTIVPVFCYIKPVIWGGLQCVSAAVIITMALRYSTHVTGFIMNFSVLTLISIVATIALYRTKRRTYIRQYELVESREREYRQAHRDQLTGLLNRRSYSEKLDELEEKGLPENTLIVSLDVNGLKQVNDTLGHKAGDELISGAAEVMRQTFSRYGKVYRIGGDEFMAVLEIEADRTGELSRELEKYMKSWKGIYCSSLSISYGYAFHAEHPDWTPAELEKAADQAMYDKKRLYYEETGCDRRRSQRKAKASE